MNDLAQEAQQRLLERRRTLLRIVRDADAGESELAVGPEPDVIDTASHVEPLPLLESLRKTGSRELVEIGAALDRINRGTYGTCELCGGAVGRQRLRAVPEARYCIECVSSRSHAAAR